MSVTTLPAGGAGPESVTVPLTLAPPTTVDGLSVSEDVAGSVTVNRAVLGTPPLYEAEMTADVPAGTAVVEMAKLADTCPAATATVAGAPATAGLELLIATTTPLGGAARDSVTVPVEVEPPTTVDGLSRSDVTVGGGGITVRVATCVPPLYDARRSTAVDAATADVVTANDAETSPVPMVTLAGTLADAGFVLASATTAPPAGAGALSVTVPVADWPPPRSTG